MIAAILVYLITGISMHLDTAYLNMSLFFVIRISVSGRTVPGMVCHSGKSKMACMA